MWLARLHRGALGAACALALVAPLPALDTPEDASPSAGPEWGVMQFAPDEAWIDLPVPLAEAWKQTLEVAASLVPAVKADLPYLESNGRIIAGDLWIAVEAQGEPGADWTRIRIAIPADSPEYGQVRAEILLDAIADRLAPPPPPPEPRFSYPSYPATPAAEGVPVESITTNNYYYGNGWGGASYEPLPSYAYVPVSYGAPWYYGSLYAPYVYSSWSSPWCWNGGWWFGWGGPWCNPWGTSFSLWYGSGHGWSFGASWGSVCSSWGWYDNWGPWCGWGVGWWDDDWDDWDGGDIVIDGDGVVIIGDDNVVYTGNAADFGGVQALTARSTDIGPLPPGDITWAAASARTAGESVRATRVTDRPSRQVPSRPVARAESPRLREPAGATTRRIEPRPSRDAGSSRPSIVVTGTSRSPGVASAPASGPRDTASPSGQRSSGGGSAKVVRLGSLPYSARVTPAPPRTGTVATGGVVPGTTASGSGRPTASPASGSTGGSHPYSQPYGGPSSAPTWGSPSTGSSSSGSSTGGFSAPAPSRSSSPSVAAPRPSSSPAPASRAPTPSVSAPRPAAPVAAPPRVSSPPPSVSKPAVSVPSGGGGGRSAGPSGGSKSGKGPR